MIKLVIFDVDGTLLDTETVYIQSALETAKRYNYPITIEDLFKTIGGNSLRARKIMSEVLGSEEIYDEYHERMVNIWDETKRRDGVAFKEGAIELITYLKENGIKIAIATSTKESRQMPNLKRTGLLPHLDYMVFGNQIKASKPAPDIYLNVIDHFNIPKEEIIIFEDSPNGLLSGIASGVKTVFIPDYVKVSDEIIKDTYAQLNNLKEGIQLIKDINETTSSI
ncbi:MAG: HAD family phosphatase [Erysipelotrichaceae bacterium]|nr:HAD family phosphatase [Erysipelotrichaceae bacterium]